MPRVEGRRVFSDFLRYTQKVRFENALPALRVPKSGQMGASFREGKALHLLNELLIMADWANPLPLSVSVPVPVPVSRPCFSSLFLFLFLFLVSVVCLGLFLTFAVQISH